MAMTSPTATIVKAILAVISALAISTALVGLAGVIYLMI